MSSDFVDFIGNCSLFGDNQWKNNKIKFEF